MLIVVLGNDNLRCSGTRGSGGRPCSPVMNDGCHALKECALVDFADRETIGSVIDQRELRPAARQNRAQADGASRFDHRATELPRRPDTPESEVDRRISGIEKHLDLRSKRTIVSDHPRTRREYRIVAGPRG